MSLEMKDRAFWHDGIPHFFYGGEMHYFRLPSDQWHDRLERLRGLGLTTVSTYVPWLWHEPQPTQFDFAGKTHPQRDLLRFLSLAAETGLTVFLRPGPHVMAELRQEGLPAWLFTRYPDVLARDGNGKPHPAGMVTYLHPTFLELVDRWYAELGAALAPYFVNHGGPVVLTQLDNEVGMLHWVSATPDDHATVQREYRSFLASASPDAAEDTYWTRAHFWRRYRARYLTHLQDVARTRGFPGPYVINVHGFRDFSIYSRGVDYPVGLSQLVDAAPLELSLLGGDFYPGHVTYDNFHDLAIAVAYTRAVNSSDAAAFSPEFQSGRFQDRPHIEPSDLDLAARVSMAAGLNGLNWYMVSAGENPDDIGAFGRHHDWQAPVAIDGSYRPAAVPIAHLGTLIRDFGSSLVLTHPVGDLTMGYYSPYYMTENPPRTASDDELAVIQTVTQDREAWHFDGAYRCLIAANLSINAVWLDSPHANLDPASYPYLWVATSQYMDCETQARLADYAKRGGTLILGPHVPIQDLSGGRCRILADTLNLPESLRFGQHGHATVLSWDSVYCPIYRTFPRLSGVEVLGHLNQPGGPEEPIIIRRATGQGQVVVVGLGLSGIYDVSYSLVRDLIAALGKTPAVQSTNLAVHVACRLGPQGHFLFVHNFHEVPQQTTVTIPGDPEAWPITVGARQGLMLPYGGVPLVPDRLRVEFTTEELTLDSKHRVRIHRGTGAGITKLRWLGPTRPIVALSDDRSTVEITEDIITIRWPASESAQVILADLQWADTKAIKTYSPTLVSPPEEV